MWNKLNKKTTKQTTKTTAKKTVKKTTAKKVVTVSLTPERLLTAEGFRRRALRQTN